MTWRRVLCRDLPFAIVLSCVAAMALAWNAASALGAPMPWRSACVFAGFVFVCIVLLRVVRALLAAGLRRCMRSARLASACATAATIVLGLPQLYVALQTTRMKVPQRPEVHGVRAHDVTFVSADGVTLRGTLLRQDRAAPVVIVCHGLGANRAAFFGYAREAFELGCHALAFDFRAHGESGGCTSTFGADEALDVAAAATWLRAQPWAAESPIVLAGVSMGAAAALRAAPDVRAAGVFAESSFADLTAMIDRQLAPLGPFVAPAHASIAFAAWLQLGIDVARVSPRDALRRLAPAIPVVLVHAGDDAMIPLDEGRHLAAARPGATLHVIDGATHGACSTTAPARVRALLQRLLGEVRRTGG